MNEGAQRAADDTVRALVRESRDVMKIAARAEHVSEFEQRLLALEAHDAVELGNVFDRLGVAERGKMATDGEVTVDPAISHDTDQTREARQVELEDERKADDQRVARARDAQDVFGVRLEVHDDDLVAVSPQHRREIAQAQIFLVQEADQKDRPRRVPRSVEQRVAHDNRV
jgi:hypothetical protein